MHQHAASLEEGHAAAVRAARAAASLPTSTNGVRGGRRGGRYGPFILRLFSAKACSLC